SGRGPRCRAPGRDRYGTRPQPAAVQGRAAPGAALDHLRGAHRHRAHGQHRHERRLRRRRRSGIADHQSGVLTVQPAVRRSRSPCRAAGIRARRSAGAAGQSSHPLDESEKLMDVVFGAFPFMIDNVGLLLAKTGDHLVISLIPLLAAIILGVPIGIWLGHVHRGEFLAVSVTNIGRALPSLALIAILIGFVGIGMLNAMIALFLLAFPPILSYAFQAVDSIDRDLTRAARGMGMSPGQVLLKVELPLGLPMIIAGIRTSAVLTVS